MDLSERFLEADAAEHNWDLIETDYMEDREFDLPLFTDACRITMNLFAPYRSQMEVPKDLLQLCVKLYKFSQNLLASDMEYECAKRVAGALAGMLTGDSIDCLSGNEPDENVLIVEGFSGMYHELQMSNFEIDFEEFVVMQA